MNYREKEAGVLKHPIKSLETNQKADKITMKRDRNNVEQCCRLEIPEAQSVTVTGIRKATIKLCQTFRTPRGS